MISASHPLGMTQDAILPEAVELLDPATIELTEREAVAAAIDGLRELIENRYYFCDRYERMMGERLPPAVKRDQNQRILYLAVIKKLEGLMWWEEDKTKVEKVVDLKPKSNGPTHSALR